MYGPRYRNDGMYIDEDGEFLDEIEKEGGFGDEDDFNDDDDFDEDEEENEELDEE